MFAISRASCSISLMLKFIQQYSQTNNRIMNKSLHSISYFYKLILQAINQYYKQLIMLANLDQLQEQLRSLIHQVSDIRNQVVNPIQAKKSNSKHSILIKLPKIMLLTRIAPYLNLRDIQCLSNVCVAMRRVIYSPLGWKFLSYTHTPYPIKFVDKQQFDKIQKERHKKMSFNSDAQDFSHDYDDQKYLKKQRAKFKQILMAKFKRYIQVRQKFQVLEEKLRCEKSAVFKKKLQCKYFQKIKQNLKQENIEYKQKLKNMSQGFVQKIHKMDENNDQLNKQNTKLQKQKQALVGKIRQYQNQIQAIKSQSEKSKQILKRLKNYLLYKQL